MSNLTISPQLSLPIEAQSKICRECKDEFFRSSGSTDYQWRFCVRCNSCETENLKERIRSAVTIDGNDCWIWTRSTKNGYGQISVRDKSTYVHQLSYQLFIGPIPCGMFVCHRCDVPPCCNPDHFFLGTNKDNFDDMRAKGRGVNPPGRFGTANHKATLSDAQVAELRYLAANGWNQRQLAARFGVSNSTAWRIANGITRCPMLKHSGSGT